jgi:hypothetical protein
LKTPQQLCVRWRLGHKTFKQAQKMNRNTELENMHCTATDAKLLLAAVFFSLIISTLKNNLKYF